MLRAFGVYLERAETFRKPLQTCCSSRCVSEWIRGCISFCFVLAHVVFVKGLALLSGLSSCFSTSAEGIFRARIPNSARLGLAVRGLCCISSLNPSLNLPCSRLPQLGMCRGSTEAWLVALILYAESLSVSLLLFHFPFLHLCAPLDQQGLGVWGRTKIPLSALGQY